MTLLRRMNAKIYTVHRWLGLFCGVVLLVIGLTGSMLAFYEELDDWQFADLRYVAAPAPGTARVSLQSMLDAARASKPGVEILGIEVPGTDPRRTGTVYYEEGETATAPVREPVFRRRPRQHHRHAVPLPHPAHAALHALRSPVGRAGGGPHRHRLPRLRGQRLVGVPQEPAAAVPQGHPLALRPEGDVAGRAHLVRVAAIAFNLVLGVSGVYLMLYAFSPGYLSGAETRAAEARPQGHVGLPADTYAAAAVKALPGFDVRSVFIPHHDGDPVFVNGQMPERRSGSAATAFRAASSNSIRAAARCAPRRTSTARRSPTDSRPCSTNCRFGQYGGVAVKALYAVGGLTPGVLSLTGFVLWWKRRKRAASRLEAELRAKHDAARQKGSIRFLEV